MKPQKYKLSEDGMFTLNYADSTYWRKIACKYPKAECGPGCAAFEYNSINNSVTLHCCNRVIHLEVEE